MVKKKKRTQKLHTHTHTCIYMINTYPDLEVEAVDEIGFVEQWGLGVDHHEVEGEGYCYCFQ